MQVQRHSYCSLRTEKIGRGLYFFKFAAIPFTENCPAPFLPRTWVSWVRIIQLFLEGDLTFFKFAAIPFTKKFPAHFLPRTWVSWVRRRQLFWRGTLLFQISRHFVQRKFPSTLSSQDLGQLGQDQAFFLEGDFTFSN